MYVRNGAFYRQGGPPPRIIRASYVTQYNSGTPEQIFHSEKLDSGSRLRRAGPPAQAGGSLAGMTFRTITGRLIASLAPWTRRFARKVASASIGMDLFPSTI